MVRNNGESNYRTQGEYGNGNANIRSGYGATWNADNVQDVAKLEGVNLKSDARATSSKAGQYKAKYRYEYWFTTFELNYAGQTYGNGNSNSVGKTIIGKGITNSYTMIGGHGENNQSPDDAFKGAGFGQSMTMNVGTTVVYTKYNWPEEGYSGRLYGTTNVRITNSDGGCQGCFFGDSPPSHGQTTTSYLISATESARGIIAQGYYSGPPLYSTTTKASGYIVANKKLSSTTSQIDTVIIAPPINACKTKPENFVWVAGGLHGFEPIAYGVAEVLMREEFYKGQGLRINFGEIGKSSWETIDNLSVISSSYSVSDIPTKQKLVKTVSGNASITNVEAPTVQVTSYFMQGTSAQKNTTQISYNQRDEDEDENPFPVITTVQTTVGQGSYVFNEYTAGTAQDISVSGMGLTTTNDYTNYFQTTTKIYPFGPDYYGGTTNIRFQNENKSTTIKGNSGTTRSCNKKQAIWTASDALGYLYREYETNKTGYFYTDPDNRYFNATGINTELEYITYKCYDAKCIDFLRYANARVFQTATTINNSRVSVNRKSPRDGLRWTKTINELSEQDDFKQTHTEQIMISPITGYPINTVSPYGDTATYSSQGVSVVEGKAKHSRIKVGKYPIFEGHGLYGGYQSKGNKL